MMNQKILIYVAFFLSLLYLNFSCQGFLEEEPTGTLVVGTDLTTVQQGEALTNGAYRRLQDWHSSANDWGNYLPNTVEYWTGKVYTGLGHPQYWRWQSDQVNGDLLGDFNNFWRYQFDGVRDCNLAIELIPTISQMPEEQKLRSLGEVRTLRAFYYFMLVRYFGDVPLVLNNPSDPAEFQLPRTSLKTIYDEVIIPDLEFALNESGLPDTRSNGRVTLDVVRAIAADVYLTCAGYPYQEVETSPDKNWCAEGLWQMSEYPVNSSSSISFLQKAKTQLDALYGKYELGKYEDLRNPDMDFRGEAIFQISYVEGLNSWNGVMESYLPLGSGVSMFSDERGTQVPTVEYYNSFSDDDRRKQERVFFFTSDTKSDKYDPNNSITTFNQPYLFKFYEDKAIKVTGQSDLNWSHYRYGDILLMLTEVNWALKELGHSVNDHEIEKGINKIRERAELPKLSAGDISLLEILSERAYELIMEQKMIWDQRRTRHVTADANGRFRLESFFGHKPPGYQYQWSKKHLLSPIGNVEMEVNDQCEQNYGYTPR